MTTLDQALPVQVRAFRTLGTTATVVAADADAVEADHAESMLRAEMDKLDLTCSRFRGDSELAHLHRQSGRVTHVSALLFELLTVAVRVAHRTQGAVDPTVGNAMAALGYDRDFEQIADRPLRSSRPVRPAPGYTCIQLDAAARTVAFLAVSCSTLVRPPRHSVLTERPPVSPGNSAGASS